MITEIFSSWMSARQQREAERAARDQQWINTQNAVVSELNNAEAFLQGARQRFLKGELSTFDVNVLLNMSRISIELRAEKYGLNKTVDT